MATPDDSFVADAAAQPVADDPSRGQTTDAYAAIIDQLARDPSLPAGSDLVRALDPRAWGAEYATQRALGVALDPAWAERAATKRANDIAPRVNVTASLSTGRSRPRST